MKMYKRGYRYCRECGRWTKTYTSYCPYCGKPLRTRPHLYRSYRNHNSRNSYTEEDAEKIYQRFLKRGYSRDEALAFTEAITGIKLKPKSLEVEV